MIFPYCLVGLKAIVGVVEEESVQEWPNEIRQSGRKPELLYDVEFIVGGKSIRTSKEILGKLSPYFNALFSNTMKESFLDAIPIKEVNYETFKKMVDYVNFKSVKLDSVDKVIELLFVANQFQVDVIQTACEHILGIKCLNMENLPKLWEISMVLGLQDLKQKMVAFVLQKWNLFFEIKTQRVLRRLESFLKEFMIFIKTQIK